MMKIFNLDVTLKNLIISLMVLYAIVFIVSFLMVGPSKIFDHETFLLSLGILSFLILIIKFSQKEIFIQSVIMAGFFLVYIIPRLIMYLIVPEIVIFPYSSVLNVGQINTSLLYVLVGSVCIYAGFFIAKNIFSLFVTPARSYPEPIVYDPMVILAIFLMSTIAAWYVQDVMGVCHLVANGGHNMLAQLILAILDVDTVFFMGIATFLIKRPINRRSILFSILIMALYYAMFTFNGSRGMALRIETIVIIILLCRIGDFKISKKYLLIFPVFLLLSYCLFPLATQNRIAMVSRANKTVRGSGLTFWTVSQTNKAVGDRGLGRSTVPKNNKTSRENGVSLRTAPHTITNDKISNKLILFTSVMTRLGLIDNAVIMLSIPAEPSAKSKYMNMSYAFKNIINLLVPGVVFKEAEINTSRVIPVLYRTFSDEYLQGGGYCSDFYTPWGIFFLIFGWSTGWFMLIVAGMMIHLIYLLMIGFGGKYRYHLGSLSLCTFSSLFYANMGIDHWIANSILIFGSGVMALILFGSGESIFSRIGSLMEPKLYNNEK